MARARTGRAARALPAGLRLVHGRAAVNRRVRALASGIARALSPEERPVAVVVLQGAFVLAADLLRHLPHRLGLEVAFVRCDSYGRGRRSSGRVVLRQELDRNLDLQGRTVLLLDDILDTGRTLRFMTRHLRARGAARVLTCVLVQRRGVRRPRADFVGFRAGREFFVGYGMDYAGMHRNLPCLACLARGK